MYMSVPIAIYAEASSSPFIPHLRPNLSSAASPWMDPASEVIVCTASSSLPCHAIPVKGCFGKPPGWKYSAAGRNRRRDMDHHVHLHSVHENQAASLLVAVSRIGLGDDGTYHCFHCRAVMGKLGQAVRHMCKQSAGAKRMLRRRPFDRRSLITLSHIEHPPLVTVCNGRVCAGATRLETSR